MIVVLDTNIIVHDFWFNSTNCKTFINGIELVPLNLQIPELVIDETINKYREILNEKWNELSQSIEYMKRLIHSNSYLKGYEINKEKMTDGYKDFLNKFLSFLNCKILSYPKIEHKDVVKSILERKKPFRKGDSGYRDYLILQSILELELYGTEQIIFITENKKDFGEGFLSDEFTDKRTWNKNIRVINSIKNFNDEFIIPNLKKFEDINATIKEYGLESFNFKKWFSKNFKLMLPYFDLEEVLVGFPYGVGRVTVEDIQLFKDFQIKEINEFENGEFLISFSVDLTVEVAVSLDWDDYENHEEVRDYIGENEDKFSFWDTMSNENITVRGQIIFDNARKEIKSADLTEIESFHGSITI